LLFSDYFRSPSPEPIYDQQGKRQNTREVRARRKIEEQRHQLVTELLALNPDYKPPGDYRFVLFN
jgi:splicing factor 1